MSWVWGRSAPPWIWLTGAHWAVGTQNRKAAPSSCRFLGCLELPRALPLHWQSMHLPCPGRTIGAASGAQRGGAHS